MNLSEQEKKVVDALAIVNTELHSILNVVSDRDTHLSCVATLYSLLHKSIGRRAITEYGLNRSDR